MDARMRLVLIYMLVFGGFAESQQAPQKLPLRQDCHGDVLPNQALIRIGTTRLRHSGGVLSLASSQDGRFLATVGKDFRVRVWDAKKFHLVFEIPEPRTDIHSVAISPNGNYMAIGTQRTTKPRHHQVCVYALPSGKLIWKQKAHARAITHLSFSKDSSNLVSYNFAELCRWDARKGQKLHSLNWKQDGGVVAISPNHTLIARAGHSVDRQDIMLMEVRSGKTLANLKGHKRAITALAFTPDGTHLFSAGYGEPVLVWNVRERRSSVRVAREGVSYFAFSPDSRYVSMVMEQGNISVWDTRSHKYLSQWNLRSLHGDAKPTQAIFVAKGRQLAVIQRHSPVIWICDLESGKRLSPTTRQNEPIAAVVFSPDGETIAIQSEVYQEPTNRHLRLWNSQSGEFQQSIPGHWGHIPRVSFSPKGRYVFCGANHSSRPIVFELNNNIRVTIRRNNQGHHPQEHSHAQSFAVSPHGLVAYMENEQNIQVWDWQSNRIVASRNSPLPRVASLEFSPDGQELAVCGVNGVVLWNWQTGGCSPIFQTPEAKLVRYSDDGRRIAILTQTQGGRVAFWDRETRQMRERFLELPLIGDVAFSPDGRTLAVATASEADVLTPEVRIYELASGQLRSCFRGHTGLVTCLAFSQDGRRLASGSEDTTALIWNMSPSIPANQKLPKLTSIRFAKLWHALGLKDAKKAYIAIKELVQHGDTAKKLILDKLRERVTVTSQDIQRTIRLLDHTKYVYRERAMIRLVSLGQNAVPHLQRAAAKGASRELQDRVETLLMRIRERPPGSEQLRNVRVNEVLNWIGRLHK